MFINFSIIFLSNSHYFAYNDHRFYLHFFSKVCSIKYSWNYGQHWQRKILKVRGHFANLTKVISYCKNYVHSYDLRGAMASYFCCL